MNDQPTPVSADDAGRILLVDDEATNLDVLREIRILTRPLPVPPLWMAVEIDASRRSFCIATTDYPPGDGGCRR